MKRSLALLAVAAVLASGCSGWQRNGATATVTSRDVQTVQVPDHVDSWVGSMIPRLHRAGLLITIPDAWGTSWFDGQSVEITSPKPGTRVAEGTTVTIRIVGPIGSPGLTTGHYVVPSVVGETLRTATTRIEAANLPWRVHASALPPTSTNDLYASYCVTAQQPDGGTGVTISPDSGIVAVELAARPC